MTKKDLTIWSGSPLSRLNVIGRFGDIFEELDKLLKSWDLDMRTFSDLQPKAAFPKVNVMETGIAYEVEIALAGFNKEEINLELKDNCLCIKADKLREDSSETKYLMKEISFRSFRRVLNFPKKVVGEGINCFYKDGIVRCVLQKEAPPEPKDDIYKIDIN